MITKHITFYFLEHRIHFLDTIIETAESYPQTTDIFIHTNERDLTAGRFRPYTNGRLMIVWHDLTGCDPYRLTWKCRDLLSRQKDDYDIFMYIEDDILVPREAIEYWIQYNEETLKHNYNLGFFRIEKDENGKEFIVDLHACRIDKRLVLDDVQYALNDKQSYCAFWIYNKTEFHRFLESGYFYNLETIRGYNTREKSAIGLHGLETPFYRGTIIPIVEGGGFHKGCRIYHLPNNYIMNKDNWFSTIPFDDAFAC